MGPEEARVIKMVSCSGIAVKELGAEKVYLKGTITGLDSSKRYCLHNFWNGWTNLPRSGHTYTYISGVSSFDLAGAGCYVPKDETIEGQQFEVACHEVERTCESIIDQACSKILRYEVTEQRYVHFYATDDKGSPVSAVNIECAGESFNTGSDGKATRIFDTGQTYYARGYAPSGYTCTDCYESFYHDSDRVVNFYLTKEEEPDPDPEPDTCRLDFLVFDMDWNLMSGVVCRVGGKECTSSGGACSIEVECGKTYTATCDIPDGYRCDCPGCCCEDGPFTPTGNGAVESFFLKKGAEPDEGEWAMLDDVRHPARLKKGENVSVDCDIKNTGDETCELVLRLYDGGGKLVDENPNSIYFSLAPGATVTKNVSTASHPLHNMPDHTIDWSVGLDEIQKNDPLRRVQKTHHTLKVHIELDGEPDAELVINAPSAAKQYEPFSVDVEFLPNMAVEIHREIPVWKDTVLGKGTTDVNGKATIECSTNVSGSIDIYGCYNPGFYKCEVESPRSRIEVSETFIDFRIECPETVTVKQTFPVDVYFKPDRLVTVVIATYPTYSVIGSGTTDSTGHVQIGITIHNTGVREIWAISEKGFSMDESNHIDIDVIEGETDEKAITLVAQGVVMAGDDFEVSGTVIGSEKVKIMQVQKWWGMMNDKLLGSVQSGEDGKFKKTISIGDFGYYQIYAKVDKPSTDWVSERESILVLTWTVVIVLVLAVALVLEKKYNKLGLFKKRR